jgi:hypothetical protein
VALASGAALPNEIKFILSTMQLQYFADLGIMTAPLASTYIAVFTLKDTVPNTKTYNMTINVKPAVGERFVTLPPSL